MLMVFFVMSWHCLEIGAWRFLTSVRLETSRSFLMMGALSLFKTARSTIFSNFVMSLNERGLVLVVIATPK
ncbi:MAG: hypothetical protein BGO08_09520 [Altererythrobacter sp. 66-12]|nr:MAG: hypothetical protein BGO08_09520 [Altererythrobacter sp. 66-12]